MSVVSPQIIGTKPETNAQYQVLPGTNPTFYDPSQVVFRKKGGIIKAQNGLKNPFYKVYNPNSSLSYEEQL